MRFFFFYPHPLRSALGPRGVFSVRHQLSAARFFKPFSQRLFAQMFFNFLSKLFLLPAQGSFHSLPPIPRFCLLCPLPPTEDTSSLPPAKSVHRLPLELSILSFRYVLPISSIAGSASCGTPEAFILVLVPELVQRMFVRNSFPPPPPPPPLPEGGHQPLSPPLV